MSAQQTIYDRIKKDLEDDKILQNVTLERLWYYLELIKDITGSGGASFTNGTGAPSGGADGDYYIRTDNPQAIYYNNAGTWEIVLVAGMNPATYDPAGLSNQVLTKPVYITNAEALDMLDGTLDPPLEGQMYMITVGIDSYEKFLTIGVLNPILSSYEFNFNGTAFLSNNGESFPATYDVLTNKVSRIIVSTLIGSKTYWLSQIALSYLVSGQEYVINNTGVDLPSGIGSIRVKATSTNTFSTNAEAYVTALGRYVPCTYDVVSNEIHYSLTATFLFTALGTIGSYEVLENNLGATLGTLTWDTDKWKIPVSTDIAKSGDVKYVDVNIGTARSYPYGSITPYAWYDNSGTNNIYFSAVDAGSTYNGDLWAAAPIKITITAQF